MQRYFLDFEPTSTTFQLPTDLAHHFITVLRAQVDDQAEFVLPDRETVILARVKQLQVDGAQMEVLERYQPQVELPVEVTLIIALAKGTKPELVVQKATELGVKELIFVETAWSVVHWGSKAAKKVARLQKVAQAAAEQSHRTKVPIVNYQSALTSLRLAETAKKVVAWEESAKQGEQRQLARVFQQLKPGDHLVALIGPEGGLTPTEITELKQVGFIPVGLGPRIMRAETAPLYILAALSYALELAAE
ncbi:RsmE family RNA methyltransferase [Weissella halotolerans]|uniref:Ribosomal RNA small subunit methyltransferase E n=1 Tax=Weissella halotolerans DSM 20190 TaxID=1123500 RepID=A0A0R2FTP8_9LACO|nr:RsmE family RNA methyltransferase [Weissella halotolerans]KRN31762.1 hypothetical protein IV68_GL001019 [Weissella halotolerans DSM 20190]